MDKRASIDLVISGKQDGPLARLSALLPTSDMMANGGIGGMFINLPDHADRMIAAAVEFAATTPNSQDRLVVIILGVPAYRHDWPAARHQSIMLAFTRFAALDWAPRRVRVNAIKLPAAATDTDLAGAAATMSAMCRWRSMTGQVIGISPVGVDTAIEAGITLTR